MTEKESYLYIICRDDYIKFGTTTNIKNRLLTYISHYPEMFEIKFIKQILNAKEIENKLQLRYKEYQHLGEWFKIKNYNVYDDIDIIGDNDFSLLLKYSAILYNWGKKEISKNNYNKYHSSATLTDIEVNVLLKYLKEKNTIKDKQTLLIVLLELATGLDISILLNIKFENIVSIDGSRYIYYNGKVRGVNKEIKIKIDDSLYTIIKNTVAEVNNFQPKEGDRIIGVLSTGGHFRYDKVSNSTIIRRFQKISNELKQDKLVPVGFCLNSQILKKTHMEKGYLYTGVPA